MVESSRPPRTYFRQLFFKLRSHVVQGGASMPDPNSLRDCTDKAYGFWNTAGAWVAAHPKSAIVAALVIVAVVIWLAY